MIVSIHQPQYLPRMQYFDKIAKSDVFVFFDDVQFSNNNYQHYNSIKDGIRLKVPIKYNFGDAINEVSINNSIQWQERHFDLIKSAYKDAPYINSVLDFLQEHYVKNFSSLSELSCSIITGALKRFGIDTKIIMASSLNAEGRKQDRVINICEKLHADMYLSGCGAKVYQTEDEFNKKGISLEYIVNDRGFNNLSFIDFVAENGFVY